MLLEFGKYELMNRKQMCETIMNIKIFKYHIFLCLKYFIPILSQFTLANCS